MTMTTTYDVSGMTCEHRVPGSDSGVTVTGIAPQDEAAVRAAVRKAGYDLTGANR